MDGRMNRHSGRHGSDSNAREKEFLANEPKREKNGFVFLSLEISLRHLALLLGDIDKSKTGKTSIIGSKTCRSTTRDW